MNLYISNLSYATGDTELKNMFSAYGEVRSAKVIVDRETQESRGFGFVDMPDEGASKAMAALNGKLVDGKTLKVVEARPKEERSNNSYGQKRY